MTRDRLELRPATPEDSSILLEWRNDPEVRANSRNTEVVPSDEHEKWLEQALADPDRLLLIAELDATPVGQVRFDRLDAETFEISISLAPANRGKGIGTELIADALAWLRSREPQAAVEAAARESNERSLAAFRAAGFVPVESQDADGFVRLREGRTGGA